MVVVPDTMLFVYPSLELGRLSDEARAVLSAARDAEVLVPDVVFAELAESLRKWVRADAVRIDDACVALADARKYVTRVIRTTVVAQRALDLALERGHTIYDALFVAVAERHATKVVTYDRALLRKFPEWSVSVPDFLARHG